MPVISMRQVHDPCKSRCRGMTTETAGTSDISALSDEMFQAHTCVQRRPLNSGDPSLQVFPNRGGLVQHGCHPAGNHLRIQIGGVHAVIGVAEDVPVDPPGLDTVGEAQGWHPR